jgi:hypothetical protein
MKTAALLEMDGLDRIRELDRLTPPSQASAGFPDEVECLSGTTAADVFRKFLK